MIKRKIVFVQAAAKGKRCMVKSRLQQAVISYMSRTLIFHKYLILLIL
jgi:hypothetical protein